MPTRIFLPECLMEAYRVLFPNLDFSRIRFYLGKPFPTDSGIFLLDNGKPGLTLTSFNSDINIYIREDRYDPCDKRCFTLIAHELVHAQQIQDEIFGGNLNFWLFKYLTCTIFTFSSGRSRNQYEKEAFDFQDKLRACALNPCNCITSLPWIVPITDPDVEGMLRRRCPGLVKLHSSVPGCRTGLEDAFPGSSFLISIWYRVAEIIALALTIIYTVGDFIVTVIQAIKGLFDVGNGSLNVSFSTDEGLSFSNKLTFQKSSEQPALAILQSHLFVGWTGTDDRLNLLFIPPNPNSDPTPSTFGQSNDDAGPALTNANGLLFIAWQSEDNNLHIASSSDGRVLNNEITLQEKAASGANPAITFGMGRIYLAWTGTDNRINIISSLDGIHWEKKITLNERSGDDGSPALAFGNGRLFLAWTGTDSKNSLNVISLLPALDGALQVGTKVTLNEFSSDDAGPALAFGNGKLFLAWTGTDDQLNIMSSLDGQIFQNKRTFEQSSDNAGPALAFNNGLLCIAWVGKE